MESLFDGTSFSDMSPEEYKELVHSLALSKSRRVFPNPTKEHACIVLSEIMNYTSDIVRVYDNVIGDLTDQNPEFLQSIKDALKRGVEFKYAYYKAAPGGQLFELLHTYATNGSKLVELKQATKDFHYAVAKVHNEEICFTLADDEKIRIEPVSGFDGDVTRSAFCSFNREIMVGPLAKVFDTEFAKLN